MFLGDPCPCGWAYDPVSESERRCECCGRRLMRQSGNYWRQVTPKDQVVCTGLCAVKRSKQGYV